MHALHWTRSNASLYASQALKFTNVVTRISSGRVNGFGLEVPVGYLHFYYNAQKSGLLVKFRMLC